MRRTAALISALLLSGCVVPVPLFVGTIGPGFGPAAGAGTQDLGTCGADDFGVFTGQPFAEFQAYGVPAGARVIRPGDAVTEDFSASRLNVTLDSADRVAALTCG
jgi:hypothetical protein